jgi:hypothetical protein
MRNLRKVGSKVMESFQIFCADDLYFFYDEDGEPVGPFDTYEEADEECELMYEESENV